MADWQELYRQSGDRMEVLPVSDGYLLRNWVRPTENAAAVQLALVYVPGALPPPPVLVVAPEITPTTALVGGTLTCSPGEWSNAPLSYDYVWRRDASELLGRGETYVVDKDDLNKGIDCVVTAINAGGRTTAPPTAAVTVRPLATPFDA